MSFSLNISGHVNDPELAKSVEAGLVEAGRAAVASALDADPGLKLSAYFSGTTVSASLLPEPPAEVVEGGADDDGPEEVSPSY